MTEDSSNSLYSRIGGNDGLRTAVTVFYNRVTADEALARWFGDIDLSRLKAHQRAFLAAALGGPPLFSGRSMREAHEGLGITHEAFTTLIRHLAVTLDDLGVDPEVVVEVENKLENLRLEVVDSGEQSTVETE